MRDHTLAFLFSSDDCFTSSSSSSASSSSSSSASYLREHKRKNESMMTKFQKRLTISDFEKTRHVTCKMHSNVVSFVSIMYFLLFFFPLRGARLVRRERRHRLGHLALCELLSLVFIEPALF